MIIDSEELHVTGKGAILVGVTLPDDEEFPESEPMDELAALADTAGLQVFGRVIQNLPSPVPATYCGKGKAVEIGELAASTGAKVVIFDNDLKPSQQRALEEATGARVIDRTELILLIFAEHARTRQAKTAVELAQMQYQLPRLRNMWTHLERQRGAISAVGGAGERQIETDRRLIRQRIQRCERDLAEVEHHRQVEMQRRSDLFQVALVGYTNAGKSTLMRALTGADVYIADKLFATLDTRTRIWELDEHKILLSDTVGFIRKLPHSLIASFHATLTEALSADLLLLVVDASHPGVAQMVATVESVLADLGSGDKRRLLVLNKADRVADRATLAAVQREYPEAVAVSALSGAGLTQLRERVTVVVEEAETRISLDVNAGNGKLLAFLRGNAKLLGQRYEGDRVHISVLVKPRWVKTIQDMMAAMP